MAIVGLISNFFEHLRLTLRVVWGWLWLTGRPRGVLVELVYLRLLLLWRGLSRVCSRRFQIEPKLGRLVRKFGRLQIQLLR